MPLSRFWVSPEEYQPIKGISTVCYHGLELNPETAYADVRLKCIIADQGYSVGDFCPTWWWGLPQEGCATPVVTATTIELLNENTTLTGVRKKMMGSFSLKLENWRYVFRICY